VADVAARRPGQGLDERAPALVEARPDGLPDLLDVEAIVHTEAGLKERVEADELADDPGLTTPGVHLGPERGHGLLSRLVRDQRPAVADGAGHVVEPGELAAEVVHPAEVAEDERIEDEPVTVAVDRAQRLAVAVPLPHAQVGAGEEDVALVRSKFGEGLVPVGAALLESDDLEAHDGLLCSSRTRSRTAR